MRLRDVCRGRKAGHHERSGAGNRMGEGWGGVKQVSKGERSHELWARLSRGKGTSLVPCLEL